MTWAVAMAGRNDLGAVLLLMEDRFEAEDLAREIRRRGQPVDVRPFAPLAPRISNSKGQGIEPVA